MTDEIRFTERELDIMSVLWRLGSGTVNEVRGELGDDFGYTSVLKMLQVLETKGHVHHEPEGRAYRYYPTVDAQEAGRSALGRLVDKIFHGSPELALTRLVKDRSVRPEELQRIRALLDELMEEAEGTGRKGAEEPED